MRVNLFFSVVLCLLRYVHKFEFRLVIQQSYIKWRPQKMIDEVLVLEETYSFLSKVNPEIGAFKAELVVLSQGE